MPRKIWDHKKFAERYQVIHKHMDSMILSAYVYPLNDHERDKVQWKKPQILIIFITISVIHKKDYITKGMVRIQKTMPCFIIDRQYIYFRASMFTHWRPFRNKARYQLLWGFPDGANGKEPTCQYRRHKRHEFSPWVGKIPWRRAQQSTPVFLPGESHGQRSLVGYSP